MIAPQYVAVGRWYLLHVAGVKAEEWQVQALPSESDRASDKLLSELRGGVWRFAAVGSQFSEAASVNPKVRQMLEKWPIIFQSDENNTGFSRLLIREWKPSAGTRLKAR